MLLPRCSSYIDPATGEVKDLTDITTSLLTNVQEEWGQRGERVILLAKKELGKVVDEETTHFRQLDEGAISQLAHNLTVVGKSPILP